MDLAKEVSVAKQYEWSEGSWVLGSGHRQHAEADLPWHVVAYDFGVKRNILRMLADRGCRLTVVPAQTPASEVLAMQPDGVFLSNGPGDPEPCDYAISAIREVLGQKLPVFGICLGHQVLGLAMGGQKRKLKFGHHGSNHPVKDLQTGRIAITAQNHNFVIDVDTIQDQVELTHVNLYDGTVEGMRHRSLPSWILSQGRLENT